MARIDGAVHDTKREDGSTNDQLQTVNSRLSALRRIAMQAAELAQRITSNSAPWVIDARSELEFKRGHIPNAVHAPFLKIFLKRRACQKTRIPNW